MAVVLVLAALAACSGGEGDAVVPQATIGSAESEAAFRPLMRAWALSDPAERQDLDEELATFVERHAGDPLVRLAQVLRAFNALDRDEPRVAMDLARGDGDADSPLLGPPGTVRDLAALAVGAADRREGRFEEALERLRPLLNKMIDGFATTRLNEELVLAAMGAKAWDDALRFMEVWRGEASPGTEREIETQIKELMTRMPKEDLLADLERRDAIGILEQSVDMASLLAQQLAIYAVWDRDSALARMLVNRYGPLLGRYGEAVARLAVDVTRGRVVARTVGLLLSLRNEALRRRSADVARGMAFGMGLPGSGARLVTRDADDSEASIRRALAEIAGEGAALVVAGVDASQSREVARYARDGALPVMLLVPDREGLADSTPFVFEVGERPGSTEAILGDALGFEADQIAWLGEGELAGATTRSCTRLPSAAVLRAVDARAIAVRDGSACDESALELAQKASLRVGVGLGVPRLDDLPAGSPVLAAGLFPLGDGRPRALEGWYATQSNAPSWWTALGHDAAVLALQAVGNLEPSGTDAELVRTRRLEATTALTLARGALWSTRAAGFDGGQRLRRRVTAREAP